MDDLWSGSDTPPLSESDSYELGRSLDTLPVFSCSMDQKDKNMVFLQSGFIARILSSIEEKPFEKGTFLVCFFGRKFSQISPYISNDRDVLFTSVRSAIFQLMRLASHNILLNNIHDGIMPIQKMKKDISRILHFCNNAVSRHKCTVVEPRQLQDITNLSNDVIVFSNSVGTLSDLISIYSLRKICNNVALQSLFHIHLELALHRILLATQFVLKFSKITSYQIKFSKLTFVLVQNLVCLSHHIYERTNINNDKFIWEEEFYVCPCVKELWIVLIHTIDTLSKKYNLQSFWSIVSTELQYNGNDESSQDDRSSFSSKYSVEFKGWLLCNVAPLYWTNIYGNDTFNEKCSVPRNWQVMQELMQHHLCGTNVNHSTVKSIIWSCISLTKHWHVNLNIFCLIWNYIQKDMNTARKRFSSYFRTVFSMAGKLESCLGYMDESFTFDNSHSSFDLFLRYLVVTIGKLKRKQEILQLSQIKCRLYSKFHKRSMNEMNSIGLENFTMLFAVFSLVYGMDEIPKKTCSFISFLQFNQQVLEIRKLIIQNLFLSLFICKHLNMKAENIVQKLIALFTSIVSLLSVTKRKKGIYLRSWDLLSYYLGCVEQSFNYINQIPDEGLLICSAYSNLLKTIPGDQKRRILVHFKSLLTSSYIQRENLQSVDLEMVWKNIYLPVCGITVSEQNSSMLAEIYATISILLLGRSSVDDRNFSLLLNTHGFSANTYASLKYSFISRILYSSISVQKIIELGKASDIISIWVNSVIQDLYKSPAVVTLTHSIINSPEILKWSPKSECNQVEHVEAIIIQYILHMGKIYTSLKIWSELSEYRKVINFYFSGITKIAENVIFSGSCQKSMFFLFKVTGTLVASCPKAIYSKNSPICLLPHIIDLFVLPFTSSKRPSSLLAIKVLKVHIHLFLSGLASVYTKNDKYLCRKIREILQKYFLEFCIKCSETKKKNPFLISLNASCEQSPTKSACEYRYLVLDCIRESFLYLPQPPQQLVSVLNFILELVQNTKSEEENIITIKLLSMKIVSCILVCDAVGEKAEPQDVRKLSINILRNIFSQVTSRDLTDIFRGMLHKFINDNLDYYKGVVLKTMHSVCLVSLTVINSLLPDIEILIFQQEKKRGVGVDGALRKSLGELRTFVRSLSCKN